MFAEKEEFLKRTQLISSRIELKNTFKKIFFFTCTHYDYELMAKLDYYACKSKAEALRCIKFHERKYPDNFFWKLIGFNNLEDLHEHFGTYTYFDDDYKQLKNGQYVKQSKIFN